MAPDRRARSPPTPTQTRRVGQQQQQQQQQRRGGAALNALTGYKDLGPIGEGSFGDVRKVRRLTDGRLFARKELNYRNQDDFWRKQFITEAKIFQTLRHDNIVKYEEHFLDENSNILYIVMEHCEGGDLRSVIERYRWSDAYLQEETVWCYLAQMARALDACHYHGIPLDPLPQRDDCSPLAHIIDIDPPSNAQATAAATAAGAAGSPHQSGLVLIHRNLKPENILLDSFGNIKIGDFGLSKQVGITKFARTCVGTLSYMSPELAREDPYDAKSDIWALGCIAYELCARRTPFPLASLADLIDRMRADDVPHLPAQYSPELGKVIRSMLSLNPRNRPTTRQLLQVDQIQLCLKHLDVNTLARKVVAEREELRHEANRLDAAKAELGQRKATAEADFDRHEAALEAREIEVEEEERRRAREERRRAEVIRVLSERVEKVRMRRRSRERAVAMTMSGGPAGASSTTVGGNSSAGNQKKEEEIRKAQDRIRADREDFEIKTASLKEYALTFSSPATEVATRERSLSALTPSSRSTEIEARERSFDSRLSAVEAREAAAYTSKMDLELKLAELEKDYEREREGTQEILSKIREEIGRLQARVGLSDNQIRRRGLAAEAREIELKEGWADLKEGWAELEEGSAELEENQKRTRKRAEEVMRVIREKAEEMRVRRESRERARAVRKSGGPAGASSTTVGGNSSAGEGTGRSGRGSGASEDLGGDGADSGLDAFEDLLAVHARKPVDGNVTTRTHQLPRVSDTERSGRGREESGNVGDEAVDADWATSEDGLAVHAPYVADGNVTTRTRRPPRVSAIRDADARSGSETSYITARTSPAPAPARAWFSPTPPPPRNMHTVAQATNFLPAQRVVSGPQVSRISIAAAATHTGGIESRVYSPFRRPPTRVERRERDQDG